MSQSVQINSHYPNVMFGTILTGATLSAEIDLGGFAIQGLQTISTMALGTISFQCSSVSTDYQATLGIDAYQPLRDASGAVVQIGPVSGKFTVDSRVMACLAAYRYVKVQVAPAQGLSFALPMKA